MEHYLCVVIIIFMAFAVNTHWDFHHFAWINKLFRFIIRLWWYGMMIQGTNGSVWTTEWENTSISFCSMCCTHIYSYISNYNYANGIGFPLAIIIITVMFIHFRILAEQNRRVNQLPMPVAKPNNNETAIIQWFYIL